MTRSTCLQLAISITTAVTFRIWPHAKSSLYVQHAKLGWAQGITAVKGYLMSGVQDCAPAVRASGAGSVGWTAVLALGRSAVGGSAGQSRRRRLPLVSTGYYWSRFPDAGHLDRSSIVGRLVGYHPARTLIINPPRPDTHATQPGLLKQAHLPSPDTPCHQPGLP